MTGSGVTIDALPLDRILAAYIPYRPHDLEVERYTPGGDLDAAGLAPGDVGLFAVALAGCGLLTTVGVIVAMRIANAIYPWAAGLCVLLFAAAIPIASLLAVIVALPSTAETCTGIS